MVRLLLNVLACSLVPAEIHHRAWIDPETRSYRDAAGRHLILHGVNVVYKVAPYIPSEGAFDSDESLNDDDIADLQSWGINLVRLGVTWEAVEREQGVYDDEYLSKIESLINKLGERGIYTMVDAHQDVWARVMCGEGVPNFYAKAAISNGAYCFGGRVADAILGPIARHFGYCKSMESYGMRKDGDGNFLIEDCKKATDVFSDFYTSPEALTVAKALWNNVGGMQDRFVDFWEHVSNKLAPNLNVIGFDPLNEPFASWSNPVQAISRIIPGGFDRQVLGPLYTRIHAVNQAADPSSILFFEPAIFPDDNPFGVQKFGLATPPGGEIGSAHHSLNMHTYCCELASQGESCAATGEPSNSTEAADECMVLHNKNVGVRSKDAERLGVPLIVSEFGACLDSDVCAREIRQVAEACDDHLASWAYWEFKTYQDITTSAGDGEEGFYTGDNVQGEKVKALARTYVRATQGTLQSMKLDSTSGAFVARMTVDVAIDASTELHALKDGKGDTWYPGKYDLILTGSDGIELSASQVKYDANPAANKVAFKIVDTELSGKIVTITLTKKTAFV